MKKNYRFQRSVDLPVEKAYRLAANVEKYPEFISSVKSARVLSGDPQTQTVEIVFNHPLLSVKHVGRATFESNQRIKIQQIEGLGKNLALVWEFKPEGRGTRVTLDLTFETNSRVIGLFAGRAVEKITQEILRDFIQAASKLQS